MISALLLVAVLLLVGVVLRLKITIFRWLYIPASVIGGLIGLVILQAWPFLFAQGASSAYAPLAETWSETLRQWPAWLIAVVFAGMLLERKSSPQGTHFPRVARQGLMVWIIVLGETAVGLLATWLLIQPFFDVPNAFGMLIETGFAGGHGTAAAMGQVFQHPTINLEGGLALGTLMATCGLVFGVVSGIAWINVGVRAGWLNSNRSAEVVPSDKDLPSDETLGAGERLPQPPAAGDRADSLPVGSPKPAPAIGHAKIGSETVDPLLFQAVLLAIAFGVGLLLQSAVAGWAVELDGWFAAPAESDEARRQLADRLTFGQIFGSFPLFIYTLFGGLVVRSAMRVIGQQDAIDRQTINRLTATAMDVLVVAAIASLNLRAVVQMLVPFSILLVCAAAWTALCLLVFARWVLPRHYWFELGLINYGMSTGTTATGFVLLRMVDPELESGAAEDYALAAPLSAPFIGGGMITIALPLLVLQRVPIWIPACVLTALVAVMIVLGRRWNARDTT